MAASHEDEDYIDEGISDNPDDEEYMFVESGEESNNEEPSEEIEDGSDIESRPRSRKRQKRTNMSRVPKTMFMNPGVDHREFDFTPIPGEAEYNAQTPIPASDTDSNEIFQYQSFLKNKRTPWNFIPLLPPSYRKTSRFSNVLDLDEAFVDFQKQIVYNTEAILLEKDENIYMVSEPPGEPYYIGRIVEFLPKPEFREKILSVRNKVDKFPVRFFDVKMNWYYRPRDIEKNLTEFDSRLLYVTLHCDICPISAYRGKCVVAHKEEILDVVPNRREMIVRSNVFYFDSLYDRFTRKYYTVYPCIKLFTNFITRPSFLYALDKKYRYVFAEKEYPLKQIILKYAVDEFQLKIEKIEIEGNSESKTWDKRCQKCHDWCELKTSLECSDCGTRKHFYCLEPLLTETSNNNTNWVCPLCTKKRSNLQEDKEELKIEFQRQKSFIRECFKSIDDKATKFNTENYSKEVEKGCYQYLGMHVVSCMNDIFDKICYPYPFKTSRFGEEYQLSNSYMNPDLNSTHYKNYNQNDRGTETFSQLVWRLDKEKISDSKLEEYVEKCKKDIAPLLDVAPENCNFVDFIMRALMMNDYDVDKAFFFCMDNMSRPGLQEPTFSAEEVIKFEEAVRKYGDDLRSVCAYVGSQPIAMIVQFYYTWKHTKRGMKIKGKDPKDSNFILEDNTPGVLIRRNIKSIPGDAVPIIGLNAMDYEEKMGYFDDSSFDTDKLDIMEIDCHCMFCDVNYSPMWYKVTSDNTGNMTNRQPQQIANTNDESSATEEKNGTICIRCARLWRRYAVRWTHPLEIVRKMHGEHITTYHIALTKMLEETNHNNLTLSAEYARSKLLEYELVQDAEFIIRQRYGIIKDLHQMHHIQKQADVNHVFLAKMVKRPFDKNLFKPERLQYDLQTFIAERNIPIPPRSLEKGSTNSANPIEQSAPSNTGQNTDLTREGTNAGDAVEETSEAAINKILMRNAVISKKSLTKTESNANITATYNIDNREDISIRVDQSLVNVLPDKKIIEMLLDESRDVPKKLLKEMKNNIEHPISIDFSKKPPIEVGYIPSYCSIFSTERDSNKHIEMYHTITEKYQSMSKKQRRASANGSDDCQNVKCAVCNESILQKTQFQKCNSCGIPIHKSCYGSDTINSNNKNEIWTCHVCYNKSDSIVSNFYNCCLCHNNADNKHDPIDHDPLSTAVKPTSDGRWCHILCSLFNDDIKYGNPKNFEPAINVTKALLKKQNEKCMICKLEGGGLVKCLDCSDHFHVTCALFKNNYKLLFRKELVSSNIQETNYKLIKNENDNSQFILTPVIICKDHKVKDNEYETYHILNSSIDGHQLTNLYSESNKCYSTKNNILAHYQEDQYYEQTSQDVDIPDGYRTSNGDYYVIRKDRKCRICKKSNSAFWFESNVCHACHIISLSREESSMDFNPDSIYDDVKKLNKKISPDAIEELLNGINSNMAHIS